ncbi:MAG: LVIVD repeat-containing protein [Gemmatimonadaceae bacterium]
MTLMKVSLAVGLLGVAACAPATTSSSRPSVPPPPATDPRVGLRAGQMDAGEANWNLRVIAEVPPAERFVGSTNSDLAFTGDYAIQGNYNGFQVWDVSNPSRPTLATSLYCPASQSDVSVYKNLLFVSGEGLGGRLDCGGQGVQDTVSRDRLRGIRIFDITDITNPKYIANVQTCRGSHTHTVLADPRDTENVYIYVSGSAPVRPAAELPGCVRETPDEDPSSALFRIEVIKVPLADPTKAAIVSSPRIFTGLAKAPEHGETAEDVAAARQRAADARAKGGFTARVNEMEYVMGNNFVRPLLDSIVKARGGTGAPTAADSAALRSGLQAFVDRMVGEDDQEPEPGPSQCHDITVYPEIGLAGGACGQYGLLLDISDPVNPVRIDAVADSNFSYWHSATFNNDGTKLLFSDEWGGGGAPKCRATDPKEWGANAIFTIENRKLKFHSYYKLPAPQTPLENCVAHNGSLIPIPGRDVMVQAWYQGGISIFDWTDPANPKEIAFFDRGPLDSTRMNMAGSWSAYWYNGAIFSSEIARGLDVAELTPSEFISRNEIEAAKTVHLDYFNAQGQPKLVWPPSFALARSYVDQLERSGCVSASTISSVRQTLTAAESASGAQRRDALARAASQVGSPSGCDSSKIQQFQTAVKDLGGLMP